MSEILKIVGANKISGRVRVNGAKNAVLPLLIATLCSHGKSVLRNVPAISDIIILKALLESVGAKVTVNSDSLTVDASAKLKSTPANSLVKATRASFWILAPLLCRTGEVRLCVPGGDLIGSRPVDLHLEGLTAMGAQVNVSPEEIKITTSKSGRLTPTNFKLRFASVGATHQIMMAMAMTPGDSVLRNAAREPEVTALADFLVAMGAEISGIGSSELRIRGSAELGKNTSVPVAAEVIGDRIEAGTFILAAAMTGGELLVDGFNPQHLGEFLPLMKELGINYRAEANHLLLKAPKQLKPAELVTAPYPGIATDLQPQICVALTQAHGNSAVTENLYESRNAHIPQLVKFGAEITQRSPSHFLIKGGRPLKATNVIGHDIRTAIAMLMAANSATGVSYLSETSHLKRGYAHLQHRFNAIGGNISYQQQQRAELQFVGC